MNDSIQKAIKTADGSYTLLHPDLNEAYHSWAGARTEAENLYVDASGLREQLGKNSQINILDIGLGLGYNALATINAWATHPAPAPVNLVSLENDTTLLQQLKSVNAAWQENWSDDWRAWIKTALIESKPLKHPTSTSQLTWSVIEGDAVDTKLPEIVFHYFWQDPFSPQKNPTMWSKEWFAKITQHAAPNATLMSYSVARTVKDNLKECGWQVERIDTTTEKRHWLKARLRQDAAN